MSTSSVGDPFAVPAPTQPTIAPPPPWRPTFIEGVVGRSVYGGEWPLNPDYFATDEAAAYLVKRFGLMGYFKAPVYVDGVNFASAAENILMLGMGKFYNAGQLALYFKLYPEDVMPGHAEAVVREAIANWVAR